MSGLDRQSFGSCKINFTGFLLSNIKRANTENKSHTHTATRRLTIQMWATVETALWKLSPTWAIKREAGWWDAVSLDCACLWNSAWFALCYHKSVSVILQTSTVRRKGQLLSHLWKKTLSLQMSRFEYEAEQGWDISSCTWLSLYGMMELQYSDDAVPVSERRHPCSQSTSAEERV